mgnify:CR=1 FL=1
MDIIVDKELSGMMIRDVLQKNMDILCICVKF